MHSGSGAGVLGWLDATALAQAMHGWLWLYPMVEIVHILGFVMLVGAVVVFDIRLLGWSKTLSVQQLGRHTLGWSASGLLLVVPAGLLMFSAHPGEFIGNRVFVIKLAPTTLTQIVDVFGARGAMEQ